MDFSQAYMEAYGVATKKSRSWATVSEDEAVLMVAGVEEGFSIRDAKPAILMAVENNYPMGPETLRTNCTGAHMAISQLFSRLGVPHLITVGDVLVDGAPLFSTSYQFLKRELRGSNRQGNQFDAHVWLTFPDHHILDVTIRTYMLAEHRGGPGIPSDFHWRDYLYMSDETWSERYTLEYRPMLYGHRVLDSVLNDG